MIVNSGYYLLTISFIPYVIVTVKLFNAPPKLADRMDAGEETSPEPSLR
jgi:hypothetical protein